MPFLVIHKTLTIAPDQASGFNEQVFFLIKWTQNWALNPLKKLSFNTNNKDQFCKKKSPEWNVNNASLKTSPGAHDYILHAPHYLLLHFMNL